METLFLYLFIVLCLIIIFKVIVKPSLVLEYPYFMGCIFFIFILPQAIILTNKPYIVPSGSLVPLLASAFLCVLMTIVGYYFAPTISVGKSLDVPLDDNKLKKVGVVYLLAGYFFLFMMERHLSSATNVSTQWSGILTIYFQLFQIINISFPILLLLAIKKPSKLNIALALLAVFPFVRSIIVHGRREVTAFFVLTIAFILFFRYKLVPPRVAIIGAIAFATLFIPATSDYRSLAHDKGPIEAIQSLDFIQSFKNYYDKAEYLELEVAANLIDAYRFHGEYEWGGGYWDNMVFRYVPAQFLGKDFKESLMMSRGYTKFRNGYRPYPGLTTTGLGDSFKQFGLLGCIFFFILGGFFRSLWQQSLTTNSPLLQFFYGFCVVQALLCVTHGTSNFVPGIFFSFLCLWLAAKLSRLKEA